MFGIPGKQVRSITHNAAIHIATLRDIQVNHRLRTRARTVAAPCRKYPL